MNGSVGLAWNPANNWNLKTNIGTGFRSGNLAELSSDGLHEGTLRYEIGDPDLKVEQNINSEISDQLFFTVFSIFSGCLSQPFFELYLPCTQGTQYLGFDVFRYEQFDADLYGSESMLAINFPFYERPEVGKIRNKLFYCHW